MADTRRGRISRVTYMRTVGQMLTRDWYTLESCEVLAQLEIINHLVQTHPERYPSAGWAVRALLDKAISGVIALCQTRTDQTSERIARFLEARRQGKSVTAIAREWGFSREYVSRTIGHQAVLLVTDRVLALGHLKPMPTEQSQPRLLSAQPATKHSA